MALAFAKALGLRFNRVQFTPDVMPSDITGFSLYRRETGRMEYQPGAVLCNLFLADELNRATSRTQSALLEAMEEGQVTVDGVSHPVPRPFMVIATQNPVGAAGTALLPDSQLDRFLLRLTIGYPTPAQELELLRRRQYSAEWPGWSRCWSRSSCWSWCGQWSVSTSATRCCATSSASPTPPAPPPRSPRVPAPGPHWRWPRPVGRRPFSGAVTMCCPRMMQCMWVDVVAHRLILAPAAEGSVTAAAIAERLLRTVEAPKIR